MKLQNRLKLASAVTIASVGVSIGSFAIVSTNNERIERIDQALATIVLAASSNYEDPLSEALVVTDDTDSTLAYISLDREVVVVRGSQTLFKVAPPESELKAATGQGVTTRATELVRMRTIAMPDNEYIVIAQSLVVTESENQANIRALLLFVLLATSSGTLLVGRLLKRDFNEVDELIESASQISQGNTSIKIQPHSGNSEIDLLAQALERMIESLQASVQLERDIHSRMQEFLGDASHELRTPLTVIKGYVELLSADAISSQEPYNRYFTRVTNEIERMESLIKDLLLLAELGNEYELPKEAVSLSGIVTAHAQDLKELDSQRPVSLNIEPNIEIEGSASLLQQLTANLFSNVRRHTPPNAPLEVVLRQNDEGIKLTVDDGGPGLPVTSYEEEALHFKRFDPSRSRDSGGSGLGMSIMSAIVRQHSGTLTLSKSHLGGLRTTIWLPSTDRFIA